jgi:prolyl 4-hydroxylase
MTFRDLLGVDGASSRRPLIRVIDGFLSADECEALRARIDGLAPTAAPVTTAGGPVMRPDLRNNERVLFEDAVQAADWFSRARFALPAKLFGPPRTTTTDGPTWELLGMNERFRGYRYRVGQRFTPHFDGAFSRTNDEKSAVTIVVYLNDDCVGGDTVFHHFSLRVRPQQGMALLFDHNLLHEGAVIEQGVKYVARTDVMYRRVDGGA